MSYFLANDAAFWGGAGEHSGLAGRGGAGVGQAVTLPAGSRPPSKVTGL